LLYAYARCSTSKQATEDKTSIAEQLAKCKAVAQLRGPVGKYDFQTFTDVCSGSTPLGNRDAGKEMLALLKPKDIILSSKMDRIFRSGADALTMIDHFKKNKIGLILCDMGIEPVADSPASTMFFSMLAAFAQFERERICERITEGKRAKKDRGGHTGGPIPFGYSKLGVGPKAILVPNEDEIAHAQEARRMASVGRTCGAVARLMAREGMLGRNGQPYNRMAVWRMINNETGSRSLRDQASRSSARSSSV
jgi:putative DNA-invertase from lambdoid prophage Rac